MNVLLLAGGAGTRAVHLPVGTPKFLTPVGSTTLADHLLKFLGQHGATHIVIACAHGREAIMRHIAAHPYPFHVNFDLRHEALGTVQATRWAVAARLAPGAAKLTPPLVVLNGDTLLDFDLAKVVAWHGDKPGATVVRGWWRSHEGTPTGVRILGADALPELLGSPAKNIEDHVWACDAFTRFVPRGSFLDVGTPEGYAKTEDWLKSHTG